MGVLPDSFADRLRVAKVAHLRRIYEFRSRPVRSECVILNKGPFVIDAVGILDKLFRQMVAHHTKKTSRLRALQSWEHLFVP